MSIVIDASVALAWCFGDEASPETDAVAEYVMTRGGLAPSIWPIEVANSLIQAERNGRATEENVVASLMRLTRMRILVMPQVALGAMSGTLEIARRHRLTAYDALYLDLAIQTNSKLATKDRLLARAARSVGITVEP